MFGVRNKQPHIALCHHLCDNPAENLEHGDPVVAVPLWRCSPSPATEISGRTFITDERSVKICEHL